ncbi:MAG: armadillo-type fold-containing protein, partial [Mastigocladus sp. ERB_26_1]
KDPLKRLIAIRLLTKLITNNRINTSELQSIGECLRFLLRHEEESTIREAAFDSLQALERMQTLSSNPMA